MEHVTIIDIAKKLGLSASTVSRALSDHPDINPETKKKVRDTASELSYSPNSIARNLRGGQSGTTIGVIVPEIEHHFFSSAISGIEEVASASNYTIIVCQSNESYEREVSNTALMIRHRVAGLLVSISLTTVHSDHFKDVVRRKIPLVFFDRSCDDVAASKVIIDDHKSSYDAVMYLVRQGRKRIAHLGGPPSLSIYARRWNGYVEAMKQSGLALHEMVMENGEQYEEHGYRTVDAMLRNGPMVDAIFAVNDSVALGAMMRIKEAKLRIPEDVAIIGFSNEKFTRLVDPSMTTVDQPSLEMGRKAAELLIATIQKKISEPQTIVIPTTLIVRGST